MRKIQRIFAQDGGTMKKVKKIIAHLYRRSDTLANGFAYFAAFVIVSMLVLQLFGYQGMTDSLGVLLPASWARSLPDIAALLVVIELFALPYFLPIALSRLAHVCAAVCAWLVPLFWLGIMFIALGSDEQTAVPLFGDHPMIMLGCLPVYLMLSLLVVVATLTSLDLKPHLHA